MTSKYPLSVVILAKNEEVNISRCVKAINWCDDIVVVDDDSTDRTAEFAIAAGARVVQNRFQNFAAQRNWAMDHAKVKHKWVLHLDADEVVTNELRQELTQTLSSDTGQTVAFRMCRKTILDNTWLKYSDGFPVWIMRLVHRGHVRFESCGHGEVAVPTVIGEMGTIRTPFLHFAFSKGLEDWITRHNRYSTKEAHLELEHELVAVSGVFSFDESKRRVALRSLARQTTWRGPLRFCYQYFWCLGFLDGRAGLKFCALMAVYEWWIAEKHKELCPRLATIPHKSIANHQP